MRTAKKQKSRNDKKLTIHQSAKRLGCSVSTIRRYILDGKLEALQYMKYGKIRINESEIDRFLSECGYQEPEN
jgi:excisionase family DNA binding protein